MSDDDLTWGRVTPYTRSQCNSERMRFVRYEQWSGCSRKGIAATAAEPVALSPLAALPDRKTRLTGLLQLIDLSRGQAWTMLRVGGGNLQSKTGPTQPVSREPVARSRATWI